ncbi:MAG: ABC transporter ATP-binding protein [Coriobacteriales bacterium]|jgi:heme exporter protein A|nr:ABC transporter ATP-binding protein [Coriobacteriales bacterium]
MPEDASVLSVRGLSRHFGLRKALEGISFELPHGSFLTVFGHNGAGKTTLLRILATLDRPTAGTVTVLGLDAKEDATPIRARIGYLSHSPLVYADLTAEENLVLFARLYGVKEPRERARELLANTGLAARRLDLVRTFSRGMTQRLSLARALIHDPQVVLLDEPYSGLDPQGAAVLDGLIDANRQGRSFCMVSHDPERGYALASHLLVLERGRMRYFGPREGMGHAELMALYDQPDVVGAGRA